MPHMESEDSCSRTVDGDSRLSEYGRRHRECCPPQVFTSVLLGILACVLVTGGVFLAFHKWDHTWLLVSAVGVLLMAIGTALHCCSSEGDTRKGSRCKGGCSTCRAKPDALGVGAGAMLTEQLLPLSNARSVSQLSLNMVPGYLPPLVYSSPGSPYGLEQHASVVQNISKLVQHQKQLHLQSPTAQSDSKSFILLPLPVDTNAANIQNIVAAVCQLDASCQETNNEGQRSEVNVETAVEQAGLLESTINLQPAITTAAPPILKHVEVQTCNDWPKPPCSEPKSSTDASTDTTAFPAERNESSPESLSTELCQTASTESQCTPDAGTVVQQTSDLPEANQIVIVQTDTTSDHDCDNVRPQPNIPMVTNDIPSNLIQSDTLPEAPTELASSNVHTVHGVSDVEESSDRNVTTEGCSTAEGDSQPQGDNEDCGTAILNSVNTGDAMIDSAITESISTAVIPDITIDSAMVIEEPAVNEYREPEVPSDVPADYAFHEISENNSSDLESELLERSSPPPSYEDVIQEAGANFPLSSYGLAYGTM